MSVWAWQVPDWWPWLLLVPIAVGVGWRLRLRAERRTEQRLGRRADVLVGARSFGSLRVALAGLAMALAVAALLRPVAVGRDGKIAPDVVLCVDVSRSMAAGDVAPTRFEAMRQQLRALLAEALGARVGVVAFAGEAQLVAPLTADRDAIDWLLGELEPGAVVGGGTDLAAAILAGTEVLAGAGAVGEIVVMTDGEHFGEGVEDAAVAARSFGHRLHCVGYGTSQGSKIAVQDGDQQLFLQDANGNDVITRCDVGTLAAVAAAGGGGFVHAVQGDELQALWTQELVPAAQRQRMLRGGDGVLQRFQWPLAIALLLWLLRMGFPERRR